MPTSISFYLKSTASDIIHDGKKIIDKINKHPPAKECRVVPPMWQAATPVLAVANVWSGGREPLKATKS